MDVLSLVCVAVVSVIVTLACVGVYLVVVERWKQQEAILTRLHEQVVREPTLPWDLNQPLIGQVSIHFGFWIFKLLMKRYHKTEAVVWRCWVCGNFFESEEQPRPLCLCNGCLEQYQKVVA